MIFNITTSTSIVLLYIFDCLVQGNWLGNQNQFNMTTILEFQGGVQIMVFNATFNNISVISWRLEFQTEISSRILHCIYVGIVIFSICSFSKFYFSNFSIFWVVLHAFLYYYFLAENCFGCHTYLLKSSLHDIFGNPIFSLYHHQNML